MKDSKVEIMLPYQRQNHKLQPEHFFSHKESDEQTQRQKLLRENQYKNKTAG